MDRAKPMNQHGHPFSRRNGARAFTLLELIAVLGVVLVLAILLSTAAHSVMERSQIVRCNARIRNLNTALLQWVQDNNQVFPSLATPAYGDAGNGIWFGYAKLILPCLGMNAAEAERRPEIFSCPLQRNSVENPGYLFNGGNQFDPSFPGIAGASIASINHPARTITLYEVSGVFPTSWHEHPGGTNIYDKALSVAAFADGHSAYTPFYWNGSAWSVSADPPRDYPYQWSEN